MQLSFPLLFRFSIVRLALTAALMLGKPAHADLTSDTKQAIQAACNRCLASYSHRDLTGIMAMYASTYQGTNVTGHTYNYRKTQAGFAADVAGHSLYTGNHATLRAITLHGTTAAAVIDWHFSVHFPSYTSSHDYSEHTVWQRGSTGWKEFSAQVTRDVKIYQHIP